MRWKWLFVVIGLGLILTAASITRKDYEWFHASQWDPTVPLHESTYWQVARWGWPLAFVHDHPIGPAKDRISRDDEFWPYPAGIDWLVWSALIGGGYALGEALRRSMRSQKRQNENRDRERPSQQP
jgi:hypothetical protein